MPKSSNGPIKLKENRKLVSPPVIVEPLYQCAFSATVIAFEANSIIDIDVKHFQRMFRATTQPTRTDTFGGGVSAGTGTTQSPEGIGVRNWG